MKDSENIETSNTPETVDSKLEKDENNSTVVEKKEPVFYIIDSSEPEETSNIEIESTYSIETEELPEIIEKQQSEATEESKKLIETEGTAVPSEMNSKQDNENTDENWAEEVTQMVESSIIDISGDDEANNSFCCNEESYAFIIENMCDPRFYGYENSQKYYEHRYNLSERYKKEHPYSEGSILKPYFPDVNTVYGFTGDYDKRELVVEAYDTSHKKKFFLINFTIIDKYQLDTVTIRELADNEVGE